MDGKTILLVVLILMFLSIIVSAEGSSAAPQVPIDKVTIVLRGGQSIVVECGNPKAGGWQRITHHNLEYDSINIISCGQPEH